MYQSQKRRALVIIGVFCLALLLLSAGCAPNSGGDSAPKVMKSGTRNHRTSAMNGSMLGYSTQ